MRSICNEYRQSDSNAYNCGGLARCCEERAKRKLLHRMHVFLQDPATKFYEVATRLCMEIGYETHDFLQLIYITIITWITWEWYTSSILFLFFVVLFLARKKRIVHEKDAFLLTDLLEYIKYLSELNRLTEPIISNTRALKRKIIGKFSDGIISSDLWRTSI